MQNWYLLHLLHFEDNNRLILLFRKRMKKDYTTWIVLALVVLGIGLIALKKTGQNEVPGQINEELTETTQEASPTPTKATAPKPPVKGDVFATSSIKNMAYQVYPGTLSDAAKVATKGWTIKSTVQKDGSAMVEFIPLEQEDKKTSYTVKKGQILYFVEINPGDDTDAKDMYLQDDYGVIVGADGLVQ